MGTASCQSNFEGPQAERCNDVDDDCDGLVDEEFEVGVPCTNGIGQCGVIGQANCTEDELGVRCSAAVREPRTENCNDIDDDCDGTVDEDFAVGETCEIGQGECVRNGLLGCSANGELTCDAPIGMPIDEACNRLDDDCDGEIDEKACSESLLRHCNPILLWRTGFDGDPLPIEASSCEAVENNPEYQCTSPTGAEGFGLIQIPFVPNAVPMGYGFGVGLSCGDDLPQILSDVLLNDCRVYFGWHLNGVHETSSASTLGACPQEFEGPGEDERSWCSSSAINGNLGGLEFRRLIAGGDGFGVNLHCQQTRNDSDNRLIRTLINRELSFDLLWMKSDSTQIDETPIDGSECVWFASSPTLDRTCASEPAGSGFGIIQIGSPSSFSRPADDIIGIRLRIREVPQ